MARKKKLSFEELIQLNRKQIVEDKKQLSEIEEKIEKRMNDSLNR